MTDEEEEDHEIVLTSIEESEVVAKAYKVTSLEKPAVTAEVLSTIEDFGSGVISASLVQAEKKRAEARAATKENPKK